MIHGKITQYDCSCFYLRKRHFCPNCKGILQRKKREVVVNSESEEAKNYDFSCVDTYLHGNIKFVTFYFQCPDCGNLYEIRELKKSEKLVRKKKNASISLIPIVFGILITSIFCSKRMTTVMFDVKTAVLGLK